MSGNVQQRQETFNDIFGGRQYDETRFVSSPPQHGASAAASTAYQNQQTQQYHPQYQSSQNQQHYQQQYQHQQAQQSHHHHHSPQIHQQFAVSNNFQHTSQNLHHQQFPQPGLEYENVPAQLIPSYTGSFPVAGSAAASISAANAAAANSANAAHANSVPYPLSPLSPSSSGSPFEKEDVVAPLNLGRRAVSSGSFPAHNASLNSRSMSGISSGFSDLRPDQMRTKSLTTNVFRQSDANAARAVNGRTGPPKMDMRGAGSVRRTGSAADMFGSTNLTSKSKSINALQRPTRMASSVSSRAPSRSQTSISSGRSVFKRTAIYPALLSKVAKEFKELVTIGERDKNGLTYRDAFTGQEAINVLCAIIRSNDRGLAFLLARALDAQKFFHDVTYEHRLRDSKQEIYQFTEVLEGLNGPSSSRKNSFASSQATFVGHDGLDYEDRHYEPEPQLKAPVTHSAVKVNGVFTLLTECYSPTCSRDNLCYSIACPRRFEQQARLNMKPQGGLKRVESKGSVHGEEPAKLLWSFSVSKEVVESVDEREKKRQEAIFETIYTERDFVKDLEYIKDFWIIPLKTKNIIPERERELFIRKVFGGINEILMINSKMAEELTNRQKQQPVVYQIGDIFINFIPRFHPFVKYAANIIFGKYEYERQKQTNPVFAKFVAETERLKESRRLDLSSFLSKPTSRPARYPLLLREVLKRTKDDNPDKKNIKKAMEMLEKLLGKINKETGYASDKYQLAILKQQLVFKPGEFVDLKLTDEQRRILYDGHLFRRNSDEIQVYLLDNTLLFVKVKISNKREQHKVFQRPIPIQLLYVSLAEEPLTLRDIVNKEYNHSLGLTRTNTTANSFTGSATDNSSLTTANSGALEKSSSMGDSTTSLTFNESNRTGSGTLISGRSNTLKLDLSSSNNSNLKWPLSFVYIGRRGYDITLYAQNSQIQRALYDAIEQQQMKLKKQNDIFTLTALTERFFDHQTNRINSAIPFYGGRRLVCATDTGIYVSTIRMCVSDNGQSRVVSNPVNVIDKPNVTQIEVLDDFQTLLAICDKKLYCWPLDVLESPNPKENSKKGKELVSHVSFFRVGVVNGKKLVCAAKNGSSHSIKIFEPIDPRKKIAKKKFKSDSRELQFNSEIVSISFLKSKLCIVGCARGFQVVSLAPKENISTTIEQLLDAADTSLDFVTRREGLKPIAIHKLNSDYLLSYSEFSFFVDVNGWRSRPTWIIHWEGLPQSFALWYPYLLSFDNNFIEIRDCNTSELLRIITGEGIRLLHASSQEILYAYVDSKGYDVVASLDFWEKANKNSFPMTRIVE